MCVCWRVCVCVNCVKCASCQRWIICVGIWAFGNKKHVVRWCNTPSPPPPLHIYCLLVNTNTRFCFTLWMRTTAHSLTTKMSLTVTQMPQWTFATFKLHWAHSTSLICFNLQQSLAWLCPEAEHRKWNHKLLKKKTVSSTSGADKTEVGGSVFELLFSSDQLILQLLQDMILYFNEVSSVYCMYIRH